jgi:hypothetical protein
MLPIGNQSEKARAATKRSIPAEWFNDMNIPQTSADVCESEPLPFQLVITY